MSDRIKASVSRSRDVNMFGELSHANRVLLENAKAKNEGSFYEFMSCLIFAAFKHEAFVNHLGFAILTNWPELERQRHSDKQQAVLNALKITIDIGRRPFQTLHDLFYARDALAHGKPESISIDAVVEKGTREELRRRKPVTKWESLCTLEFADRAYEDTEKIAELLWNAAGFDVLDLRARSHQYSILEIPR
jgi:hypothetical protein